MSLFKKKFDYEYDRLYLKFLLEKQEYVYYCINQEVPYQELNRRTKKKLDIENMNLKENSELLQQNINQIETHERINFLRSKGISCTSFEYLGPVNGTMSKEMEEFLNNITAKKYVVLGIHRVRSDTYVPDNLINGLVLSSHLTSWTSSDNFSINNCISIYEDNKKIIKELMYADLYKASVGSFLIEIPYEDLDEDLFLTDEQGMKRLNPKYIVGYVPLEENHHLERIIKASDIIVEEENKNLNNEVEIQEDEKSKDINVTNRKR